MITLKKSELENTLLTISAYDSETRQLKSGLLAENLTLGTKRKLQKIHKEVYKAFQEFVEQVAEVRKVCGENKEKLEEEFKLLIEEEVKIDQEKIQLSFLENISTTQNYNFDLIEKFAA